MAVQLDEATIERYEDIFRQPTLERMLGLEADDFERFVGYVFNCSGYAVEPVGRRYYPDGPGVDFNLYTGEDASGFRGEPIARAEVRRYGRDHLLDTDAVMSLIGRLHSASDVPGFLVTTSDFREPARIAAANSHGLAQLINGDHLLRYITYVGASRYTDKQGIQRTPTRVSPACLLEADTIPRRDPTASRVLAIANNRGGIGKTTATVNLGFALAQQGNRVLLVDMDGQASLTSAVPPPSPLAREPRGATPPAHARYLSEFFTERVDSLGPLVQRTRFDHLYVLAANAELHKMDRGGGAYPESELRFVRALHSPSLTLPAGAADTGPFDWILIDTPPAQSFFTRAALAAAHFAVIPIEVEAFASRGIRRVLETARAMRALAGNGAEILGALVTCWRAIPAAQRDKWTQLQADLLAEHVYLFDKTVPYDDKIDLAHLSTIRGTHRNIFGFGGQIRPAAQAYLDALKTIKERIDHAN